MIIIIRHKVLIEIGEINMVSFQIKIQIYDIWPDIMESEFVI